MVHFWQNVLHLFCAGFAVFLAEQPAVECNLRVLAVAK
jgi:hypothetical protein